MSTGSFIQLTKAEWCIYASVNKPSLVQIMPCPLVGAEPLSDPMLEYCYFGTPGINFSEILSKIHTLSFKQGKSEGFDSCDRPRNLTKIGFKSSIFQPNLIDDLEKL